MSRNIYGNDERLRRVMDSIQSASPERISERDKKLLWDFYYYCYSTNLTTTRVLRYMITLWKLTEFKDGDFEQMGKMDIQKLVSEINRKHYSPHTKKDYRIALKKFYQWLEGDPTTKEYPDKVKWIKTTLEHNGKKLPEEILTKDDVREMIKYAGNLRNKAFISILYESGCRIGELLSLKWKHMDFSLSKGVKMRVDGKTGTRRLLLVSSEPHIKEWRANYPGKLNGNGWMWISLDRNAKNGSFGQPLNYGSVRMMLKRVAENAGVEKDVNPHSFRHARATHLASHLTEAQMCEFFGWEQGSKQPSTYVHLSGRDLDTAIKKLYGLEEEKKVDNFDIKYCPGCGHENGPEKEVCEKCGHEFGKGMEDKIMDIIKNDPEKWGSVLLDAMEKSKVSGSKKQKMFISGGL